MMKNQHSHIDKFFSDGIGNFRKEPSASVWDALENKFFPGGGGRNLLFTLFTSALLLISTGITTYFVLSRDHTIGAANQDTRLTNPQANISEAVLTFIDNETADQINTIAPENTVIENITTSLIENPKPQLEKATAAQYISNQKNASENDPSEYLLASLDAGYYKNTFHDLLDKPLYTTTSRQESEPFTMSMLQADYEYDYAEKDSRFQPDLKDPPIESAIDLSFKDDYGRQSNLGMGVHLSPGVIFYDINPSKNIYAGDVTLNYSLSNFSIKAGAGFLKTFDVGKYKINYTSYDSVGFYREVVSFTFDQERPDSVIVNYRYRAVYDSVPHYTIAEQNNSYTYLQFPVSFGYKVYNKKRISLSLNAGMIYTLLINKYEPTVDFSVESGNLESVSRQVPARVRSNLMFSAGFEFSYQISSKVYFTLSPYYSQYLQSVYETNTGYGTDKPFIIGIRTGVDFNF